MSEPGLYVSGATHHNAPIELREKLAPGAEPAALHARLAAVPGIREFALLSTCNRIEFYAVADSPSAIAALESEFCAHRQFQAGEFNRIRLALSGPDAVHHLFDVAAGLDSQIVGENEIFGQVKEAYAAAQASGTTGPVLNRLFQKTFQAAKYVRTHTAVSGGQVSIANVAVDLAANIFGELSGTRVLLLGAGDIAEKTAQAFRSRGSAALSVASRTPGNAAGLASQVGGDSLPLSEAPARLAEYDVVVGSTAAPETVIQADAVRAAMHRRPARPLFFIDVALPRDIDPAVASLDNVFLYNLDDLAGIAEKNRALRLAEVERCRTILRERAGALWRHLALQLGASSPSADPGMPAQSRTEP